MEGLGQVQSLLHRNAVAIEARIGDRGADVKRAQAGMPVLLKGEGAGRRPAVLKARRNADPSSAAASVGMTVPGSGRCGRF